MEFIPVLNANNVKNIFNDIIMEYNIQMSQRRRYFMRYPSLKKYVHICKKNWRYLGPFTGRIKLQNHNKYIII